MAASTYTARVIVLRKTKLGESDLILTFLAQDGSQTRAVAKGARKPNSSFSSRLELYSCAEVFFARGKTLDIVREARLVEGNGQMGVDLAYAAAAAPMAELLEKMSQVGLENAKLFEMSVVALKTLGNTSFDAVLSISAAHLLKAFAFCGLRPHLDSCLSCGREIESVSGDLLDFSFREGGLVCADCASSLDTLVIDAGLLHWVQYLLGTSFADITKNPMDPKCALSLLQFCQSWTREHIGQQLRSLNYLLTSGLYDI